MTVPNEIDELRVENRTDAGGALSLPTVSGTYAVSIGYYDTFVEGENDKAAVNLIVSNPLLLSFHNRCRVLITDTNSWLNRG